MATGWCRPHCRAPFAQDCAGRLADRTVAQRIQNFNLQRKPLNYFSKSLLHETQCCSLFQSFTFPCMRFNQKRTQLIMLNEPNHAFHLSIFYVSLSSRFGHDTAAKNALYMSCCHIILAQRKCCRACGEPCLLANTSFWSPQKTIVLSTRLVPPSHCTIYNHTHIFLSLQIQIRCD